MAVVKVKNWFKKFRRKIATSRGLQVVLFVVGFAAIGAIMFLVTHAGTPTAQIGVSSGILSGQARLVADSSASSGQAVQFGSTPSGCTGIPMTAGQTDINNNPAGTTFCLSGTHNWTLKPKSNTTIIGDDTAVLDGANSTQYAIVGNSGVTNVTLRNIEIRNYTTQNQHGAVETWQASTGWVLDDLQVHDNGFYGANIAAGTLVTGGRFYNNHQGGISGGSQDGWTVDGVEIDHNNFTDNTYTTRNVDCGFEAGGMKWVGDNITVKNSKVHDNACKGLWADIGAVNTTLTGNQVYNNWDEGIFFEISTSATITGNTAYGNGFHDISGCNWGWGGGITTSSSGLTQNGTGTITISGNTVYDNCNGITLIAQHRTDSGCSSTSAGYCVLKNVTVSGNTITGSTRSGARNTTGAYTDATSFGYSLTANNLVFGTNTILGSNMNFCKLSC
jgi:parallel beta-helix repeat protein